MPSETLHGRERELAELRRAGASPRRVVWICGPPGVGKSRLAAELVLGAREPDGKVLVVALRDASAEDLVERLVRSLPAVASDADAPLERFALACAAHAIATIVLDDVDAVRAVLPDVLLRLLGLAPSLRVVVTARAAPLVSDAQVVRLAPLETPAATELARAVLASLSTATNDDELAQITAAADGLPGAVVEAASALATTRPGVAIDASLSPHLAPAWARFAEPTRRLLGAAACFAGRIDAERLELVASLGSEHRTALEAALRDGWLEGGLGRGVYRMLRPVRRFVERRGAADKHRELARVVEAGARRLLEWPSVEACGEALDAIAIDAPNLNAAVLDGGLSEPCETALVALGALALARGIPPSAYEAFSVEWAEPDHPLRVRRELLVAEIAIDRGEPTSALRRLEALPRLGPELAAERGVLAGSAYLQRSELARARALVEPHRDVPHVRAHADGALGLEAHISGRLDEAAALYRRAEAEHVARGAWTRALRVRNRRAFLAMDRGDVEEAGALLESLLADARTLRMTLLEGTVLGYLGNLARDRRDFARARDRYRSARALLREAGETRFERTFAMDEATVDLLCHRPRRAVEILAPIASDLALRTLGRLPVLVGCYLVLGRAMLGEEASAAELALADAREDRGLVEIHRLALRAQAIARGEGRGRRAARDATEKVASTHALIARELLSRLELTGRWEQTDVALTQAEGQRLWLGGKDVSDKVVGKQLRIVLHLLRARIENPGATLTSAALIAAGWPGDRSARAAAENRLRVALSALRRSGLARVLERTPHGYRLAESARIALVAVDLDEVATPGSD